MDYKWYHIYIIEYTRGFGGHSSVQLDANIIAINLYKSHSVVNTKSNSVRVGKNRDKNEIIIQD